MTTMLGHLLTSARLSRADHESVVTTIDDTDPGIKYLSGTWVPLPKDKQYYNGTERLTRAENAIAQYVFNGTGISVFGTECDPGGNITTLSSYSIDGNLASFHSVPAGVKCNQNFVQFYSTPPLSNGQHTLTITNLNDNAWYFLDYLEVTAPASTSATAGQTPAPTSAPSEKSNGVQLGVIAAIALGAAALAACVILWALWLSRKKRSLDATFKLEAARNGPRNMAPYHIPQENSVTQLETSYLPSSSTPGDPSRMTNTSTMSHIVSKVQRHWHVVNRSLSSGGMSQGESTTPTNKILPPYKR